MCLAFRRKILTSSSGLDQRSREGCSLLLRFPHPLRETHRQPHRQESPWVLGEGQAVSAATLLGERCGRDAGGHRRGDGRTRLCEIDFAFFTLCVSKGAGCPRAPGGSVLASLWGDEAQSCTAASPPSHRPVSFAHERSRSVGRCCTQCSESDPGPQNQCPRLPFLAASLQSFCALVLPPSTGQVP